MAFLINESLNDSKCGIKNYIQFVRVINHIWNYYEKYFGKELMEKVDLFIDNATCHTGFAPVTMPVFDKFVIIKLQVQPDMTEPAIGVQFSHELLHFVFHCKYGLTRNIDIDREEAICTAAALIYISNFYKELLPSYKNHVATLEEVYRNGITVAENVEYNFAKLIKML